LRPLYFEMKVLLVLALVALSTVSASKLEAKLEQKMLAKNADTFNVFLKFDGNKAVLNSIKAQKFTTRANKITQMRADLIKHAAASQSEVLSLLQGETLQKVQSFWVNNEIYVRGASAALINKLATFEKVTYIREEKHRQIVNPLPENPVVVDGGHILAGWNVELINAHLVWELEGAGNGEGVRIGQIDTGVRSTHMALDDARAETHFWRDPEGNTETQNDQNGHGTHTMGTIVGGANGIGVAPGASWMACKGCGTSSCTDFALIACGEWTLCPTDPDGISNPQCGLAPVVSSNSWGSTESDPFYNEVIDSWIAADIVPVFANGNAGPECNTTGSPSDYDVVAVGSINNANALSTFSSKGPSVAGEIRPHVVAPGTDIYSSYYLGPNSYTTMSGTSMACPHVAGVVALMYQVNPDLTFAEVRAILEETAHSDDLTPGFRTCGDIPQDTFPNNAFGAGRVDALAAVQRVLAGKKH
jgi:subtilisin family serine protease